MKNQRRAFDRMAARIDALMVRVTDWDGGRIVTSRDISSGGVFIETPEPPAVGDRLNLFLSDRRARRVLRVGVSVVRSQPGVGFAAEFVWSSARAQHTVESFVTSLFDPRNVTSVPSSHDSMSQ